MGNRHDNNQIIVWVERRDEWVQFSLWLHPAPPAQCWLKEHPHKSHAPDLLSVRLNLWYTSPYHAVTGKWTQRFQKGSNKLTNYFKTSFFLGIKVGTIIDSSAQNCRKNPHGANLTQASLNLLGWGVNHPQSHIQACYKLGKPEPGLSKAHQLEQPSVGYRDAQYGYKWARPGTVLLLPLGCEPVGGDQGAQEWTLPERLSCYFCFVCEGRERFLEDIHPEGAFSS